MEEDEFRTARDLKTVVIEEILFEIAGLNLPQSIFNKQRMFLEQMLAKRKAGIPLSKKEQKKLEKIRFFFENIQKDHKLDREDIRKFIISLEELEEDNCNSLPDELKLCKKKNYRCKITIKDVQPFIKMAATGRKLCNEVKKEDKRIQAEKKRKRIAIVVIVIIMLLLFWSIAGIVYAATEDIVAFWWTGGILTGGVFISIWLNSDLQLEPE